MKIATNKHEEILKQLPDFVLGEVGKWQTWRISRHIAQCAACQKERDRLVVLYGQLRTLQTETPPQLPVVPNLPNIAPSTFVLGGKTMNRRAVIAASAALILATTGGAIAYKTYATQRVVVTSEVINGNNTGWMWFFSGNYQGKVQVFDIKGKPLTDEQYVNNSSPQGTLHIRREKGNITISKFVSGFGKHLLVDHQGKTIGFAILSPMTATEQITQTQKEKESDDALIDYYNSVNRVATSSGIGSAGISSYPQMIGGTVKYTPVSESFNGGRRQVEAGGGMSWKVYGDVKVKMNAYLPKKTIKIDEKQVTFPASTVPSGGESTPMLSSKNLPTDGNNFFHRLHIRRLSEPEIYWTIAQSGGIDSKTGRWEKLDRSGSFKGYGKHEVKDENGKVLMRLEVLLRTKVAPLK
jgi:Putative zinc-finger